MLCAEGVRCADEHTASVIKAPRLREASGYGAEYGECLHRACPDCVAFLDEQAQRTSAIGRPQAGVGRSGDSAEGKRVRRENGKTSDTYRALISFFLPDPLSRDPLSLN